ncbi:MAG TPA: bifunctional riboflavin kinase/FAD synthetase, partial [Burkholderiaceae bacterium]|nr:bifunctional riboflavin kinase/FAD synthetase [Burkholderiaceae bacterium]
MRTLPVQVFRRLPPPAQRRPCVLTIGNFDGVHRGHQALLDRLTRRAREQALPSCVLTFEPHPREFFAERRPGVQAPARIATLRDKLEALRELGVDRVCVAHFNERLATQTRSTP